MVETMRAVVIYEPTRAERVNSGGYNLDIVRCKIIVITTITRH